MSIKMSTKKKQYAWTYDELAVLAELDELTQAGGEGMTFRALLKYLNGRLSADKKKFFDCVLAHFEAAEKANEMVKEGGHTFGEVVKFITDHFLGLEVDNNVSRDTDMHSR